MANFGFLIIGVALGFFIAALCQISGRCREMEEAADAKEIYHAKDDDDFWFCPSENPFTHICCDCGLTHKVEYVLVDREGEQKPSPDKALLALKFTRA